MTVQDSSTPLATYLSIPKMIICLCQIQKITASKSLTKMGDPCGKLEVRGQGQFSHPRGLAIDIAGNLVVADMGNHRLQILAANGKFVKEAGSEGSGDGQLSFPESVAIMPNSGYIVVSDLSNNRLQVF